MVHSWTEKEKMAKFLALKTMFEQGMVELPPDQIVRADLTRVRKIIRGSGTAITFPRTSDGRHCDYAPCTAMALARYWQTDQDAEEATANLRRMSEQEADIFKRIIDRSKKDDGWGFSW